MLLLSCYLDECNIISVELKSHNLLDIPFDDCSNKIKSECTLQIRLFVLFRVSGDFMELSVQK